MQRFFEQNQIDENEVIAVGVSGGADSLALILRMNDLGKKVVALSVDHGLRPTSSDEAKYVAKLMKKTGIEHHILVWEGEKPTSDVEAIAREARYKLLCDWCKNHNVKYLAIGHHRRDQAETFLLRLQRGSGLQGLCGMYPLSKRGEIFILRPQLDDDPDVLRDYLKQKNIDWVEDESNQCEDFMRVKMRKFLPELETKIGLTEVRLAETAKVLQRTQNYFEYEVAKRIKNQVRELYDRIYAFSVNVIRDWHEEIAYRVLEKLLRLCGNKSYAPEAEEILRLLQAMQRSDFKGCTLNGCEILVAQKRIWMVPEVLDNQVLSKSDWDKCLHFVPQYAKAGLPYKVRRAIYNQIMKDTNGQ